MKVLNLRPLLQNMGCCNQLFSLVNAIAKALTEKYDVIVLPGFLKEINTPHRCKFSEVIDLPALNRSLEGSLTLIDTAEFSAPTLVSATFGAGVSMDVTNILRSFSQVRAGTFPFPFQISRLGPDPAPGQAKELRLTWRIGKHTIPVVHKEVNGQFTSNLSVNEISVQLFYCLFEQHKLDNYWLVQLEFAPDLLKDIPLLPAELIINAMHLRLEPDSSKHWARLNKMNETDFSKLLISKYIGLIQKYIIPENSVLILLSYDTSNPVTRWLTEHGYRFVMLDKKPALGRELNAIRDLSFAQQCNGTFIGCEGSSFTYVLKKRLMPSVHQVFLDINRLQNK